jgi:hypothetical protein
MGARIFHHVTDELHVENDTFPDGEATPVQERNQHFQSLDSFLRNMIDVRPTG